MGFLKNGSLMALLWASRTLATPLIAESLFGRDSSACPSSGSFTSNNGLNFTNIQCNQNNMFNDALDPFVANDMSDCMEYCSRFWGSGEGCFGVVFRESDNYCWMRNSTTSKLSSNKTIYTKTLTDEDGIHSALVDLNMMKSYNTSCPDTDKSSHNLTGFDGVKYTVQCNKDIGGGYDAHWSYPYHDNPFQAFYHASSLEDCLGNCMKEHPLCRGVLYNPSLSMGYANCWPKTGFPQSLATTSSSIKYGHSATIDNIPTPDTDCNKNDTYTSTSDDSKNFAVHCGQTNQGTNMTSVHRTNFTSCMEACATNKNGCVGAVYDSSLSGGFDNCYLQNTSSIFNDISTSMYGVVSGAKPKESGSGSDSSSSTSDSSSSGSKAWIAGAVIGPIAGLALIGAAIWFFRRRQSAPAPPVGNGQEVHDEGAAKLNPYANNTPAPAYAPVPQYSPRAEPVPSELGSGQDHQMIEMEGATAAKYAHKGGAPGQEVHEMG